MFKEHRFPLEWLLSGGMVSACYLPWLLVLYRQTNDRVGNYWISDIDKETILGYFTDIFSSRVPYSTAMFVILWLVAIVLLLVSIRQDRERGILGILLFLVPVFTALLGIIVSVLVTPFFVARYLIPCMGIWALGLALAFRNEKGFTYIFLCLFLVCMIGNSYYENYKKEYLSTNVDEFLTYMDENLDDDDIIIYNYETFGFIYECYFDEEKRIFLEDFDFNVEYDNIWFIDSCCTPWLREVKCDVSQGYLQFCILDAGKDIIYERKVPLKEMASPGWYAVFSKLELIAGETYYLTVDAMETQDDGPGLGFFTSVDTAGREEEGQELTYAGFKVENGNLKISFEYLKPLPKWDYLAYYFFVIFIVAKILKVKH